MASSYGRSCSAASGLRATVALKAGRGAKPPRAAEGISAALRLELVARLALRAQRAVLSIVATARACCRFESCERAHAARQPCDVRRVSVGGWHAACAIAGTTRTDNKPLFRSSSEGRIALLDARGRQMRFTLTPSEKILWSRLSERKLGVVFRRQVPLLGRFIVDFLAPGLSGS